MNPNITATDGCSGWQAVRGDSTGTEQVPMEKQVSSLNTLWLIACLRTYHPEVNIYRLVEDTFSRGPFFISNLHTDHCEPVAVCHLESTDYWFSNIFMVAFYCSIEEHCADPDFAFKCGSTFYKSQSSLKTAIGVPLIGPYQLIKKIVRENDKYNRTKTAVIRSLSKGYAIVRLIHKPNIIMTDFAIKWHLGLFESYARLAGVTDIKVRAICIECGPQRYGDPGQATYDFEIIFRDPGFLSRIGKRMLYVLPPVRELIDGAEQIQASHNEEILNRDKIINERTAALVKANETMRVEIADRERTERALLQSQGSLQRYITAIDDIGLGLCVINSDYRLCMRNKTMIGWFGDYLNGTCHSVIMGQDSPCPHCRLSDVVEQASKVRYQHTIDGRRLDIVATPISNDDGTISKMLIIRDITEQHQQEQRRLEISRQQEELKKLASLKNMAGAIAHRFNNSMVSVQGNLELLTLFLPNESKEHRMAAHAFQAAKGASQIGSVMLSYVGQQPQTLRKMDLVKIVRETVTASKQLFHPEIALQFNPSVHPLYCCIDRQQLNEVIENILTNALESLKNGSGTIEVTFGTNSFTRDKLPIFFQDTTLQTGMYAFCQIKDSGQGISAEDLPKVFEPFYTTKFVGRGLGLAMSAGIMKAHHGALTFDSTPERGTTVKVLLPSIESPVQQISDASSSKTPTTKLSGNILLVDDETIVLEVGEKILTTLGFSVDTAVNGKEALSKVRGSNMNYCAIVMDISMPEMNGIEAMALIRKIDSSIPIILSSGYSEGDFIFGKDRGSQPNGFLPKPFTISDLQSNLETILST